MEKTGKLKGILQEKCPACRKGKVFLYKPYSRNFAKMNPNCPVCNFRFEVEPGFFWAAMYFSYAFSVGIMLVAAAVLYFFFGNPSSIAYILTISLILIVFLPLIFRYSRILLLYFFSGAKYRPDSTKPH
jgi:uncharacterized protein (DUF983 family)